MDLRTLLCVIVVMCVTTNIYSEQLKLKLDATSDLKDDSDDLNYKGSALATVENEDDSDDVVINYTQETIKYNDKVFKPTKEWQTVEEGQSIPRGLHVRLNVNTGEKEAKLLDESDDSSRQQTKPHIAPDKHELLKDSIQQAMKELENSEYSDESSTEEIKYWKDGDKQGMLNTKQPYFTHSELKQALKKFKAAKDDVQNPQNKEDGGARAKFRSMDEIREDFKSLNMDMKTDLEILTEILTAYKTPDLTTDERISILTDLEYYVHQIDNAQNFAQMGGLQLVIADLNSTSQQVRSEAAFVVGSAVQSNPKVQIEAIEGGALHQLIRMLSTETSIPLRIRVLTAISSLVRHFPYAQRKFLELGGLQSLASLITQHDSVEKMWVKAITLINDLLTEQVELRKETLRTGLRKEKSNQYDKVPILEAVIEQGWCDLIPNMLLLPEHDSREKVLAAMFTLRDSCVLNFSRTVPQLRTLRKEYSKLSTAEQLEDDDTYFTDILKTIDQILARQARDEL